MSIRLYIKVKFTRGQHCSLYRYRLISESEVLYPSCWTLLNVHLQFIRVMRLNTDECLLNHRSSNEGRLTFLKMSESVWDHRRKWQRWLLGQITAGLTEQPQLPVNTPAALIVHNPKPFHGIFNSTQRSGLKTLCSVTHALMGSKWSSKQLMVGLWVMNVHICSYLMKCERLHQCWGSMRAMSRLKSSPQTSTSHCSQDSLQSFFGWGVVGSVLKPSSAENTQIVELFFYFTHAYVFFKNSHDVSSYDFLH